MADLSLDEHLTDRVTYNMPNRTIIPAPYSLHSAQTIIGGEPIALTIGKDTITMTGQEYANGERIYTITRHNDGKETARVFRTLYRNASRIFNDMARDAQKTLTNTRPTE